MSSGDDVSVGQIIVDAGALPALLYILQRTQLDPEILQLGCEILDGLSEGYANETLAIAIASSDFIKVLIKLAGETEIQTASKALDTAGKLVVSKRSLEEEAEKKQRAISLGIIPRLLEVFGRKDAVDAIIEACNFSCMLALPPVALSDEHVGEILGALVPLVSHAIPAVRLSVHETVKVVLFCSAVTSPPASAELTTVILDLIEHYDHGTPVAMAQAALEILSRIATRSSVPRLLALLRTVHDTNALLVTVGVFKNVGLGCNTEEKNELAKTHDIFTILTPLLRSPEEVVSTWTSEAVSAFSTAENIPLFITFLKGDDERLKLMAIRILKDLVAGVSEDAKLAVVHSGVLSDLHYLLQKSPAQTSDEQPQPGETSDDLSDVVNAGDKPTSDSKTEHSLHDSTARAPSPSKLDQPSSAEPAATPDIQERPEAPLTEPVVESNAAAVIKQPVNNVVLLPTVNRAIELRDSAFAILDAIATNASDNGMEIIADAYVKTDIHTALVGLLKEPAHDPTLPGDDNRRNCIFVLQELARGTDFAKREIIKTDIFAELRRIMHVARGGALRWCCLLIYNLLSSDEVNEDIVASVLEAGMLERLVANVKKTNDNWRTEWESDWQPSSAAQALSCLVLSSEDSTWDELRKHDAIACLQEFLQSLELVESLFAFRTWMLVEYLEHPQVDAQKLGLFLVEWYFSPYACTDHDP
ncbi:armadillo-type protein [Mycena filopes]|nr:armadillo-type protein [Mycena filopes]